MHSGDQLDLQPNPEPEVANEPLAISAEKPVVADSTKKPEGSSSARRFTIYEISTKWNLVLEDFQLNQPLLGGYLQSTKASHGDYSIRPFEIKISFPHSAEYQYRYFIREKSNLDILCDYLEILLDTVIKLEVEVEAFNGESETNVLNNLAPGMLGHRHYFEKELIEEPIMKTFMNLFEAAYVTSRKLKEDTQ